MELIFDAETQIHKWTELEGGQWSRSGHRGRRHLRRDYRSLHWAETPRPWPWPSTVEIMNVISAAVSVPVQLSIVIFVMASFIAFLLFP